MSAPVEVPEDIVERIRALCLALPEVTVRIDAAVNAYRQHVEPTDVELDRLGAVMYIRTLYLACFGYRRALTNGSAFSEWGFIEPPGYFNSTAAAVRAAFRR